MTSYTHDVFCMRQRNRQILRSQLLRNPGTPKRRPQDTHSVHIYYFGRSWRNYFNQPYSKKQGLAWNLVSVRSGRAD